LEIKNKFVFRNYIIYATSFVLLLQPVFLLIGQIDKYRIMNKLIVIWACFFFLTSCGHSKKYKVQGKIFGINEVVVYLKEMTTNDFIPVDSFKIDKSGEFILKGVNNKPAFYMLGLSDKNYLTLLIHPGDKLYITAQASNLERNFAVKGSKDSELVKELNDKINETLDKINELGKTYNDSIHSPRILAIRSRLDSIYNSIENKHRDFTFSFIRKNIASMASIMALYQQITPRRALLNITDHYEYFRMVDSAMMKNYPEADAVMSLHNLMNSADEKHKQDQAIERNISIGSIAPELELPSKDGSIIKLGSSRGKYVLLYFWASWNKPCRDESYNFMRNYWRYKYQGFEIYLVSLDKNKDTWLKALLEDQIWCISVCDLKMWDSPVAEMYCVRKIPSNLLLDPDGRIVAKDLFGKDLSAKLKEIFKY
jgi:thiol-disulfide isomerase/thioredoxin